MSEWTIDLQDVGVFRSDRWILRGVNWRVAAGTCAAILGPNGSGKSTLARVVSGHLWPSHGECRVLGERFGETDLAELRKDIRLLQPAGPYDADAELTAREVVVTGFFGTLGLYKEPTGGMWGEADRTLAQVGLGHVADHRYSTLSSGERVRTLIARALVQRPKLLLLDEPTAGLDLLAREQILATVQRLVESGGGPTLLMITHHVEELPPATSEVILLSEGAVAARGTPKEVLRAEVLSDVYGCPVKVNEVGGRYYLQVHPGAWDGMIK